MAKIFFLILFYQFMHIKNNLLINIFVYLILEKYKKNKRG